jgi:hypothetical protein
MAKFIKRGWPFLTYVCIIPRPGKCQRHDGARCFCLRASYYWIPAPRFRGDRLRGDGPRGNDVCDALQVCICSPSLAKGGSGYGRVTPNSGGRSRDTKEFYDFERSTRHNSKRW